MAHTVHSGMPTSLGWNTLFSYNNSLSYDLNQRGFQKCPIKCYFEVSSCVEGGVGYLA